MRLISRLVGRAIGGSLKVVVIASYLAAPQASLAAQQMVWAVQVPSPESSSASSANSANSCELILNPASALPVENQVTTHAKSQPDLRRAEDAAKAILRDSKFMSENPRVAEQMIDLVLDKNSVFMGEGFATGLAKELNRDSQLGNWNHNHIGEFDNLLANLARVSAEDVRNAFKRAVTKSLGAEELPEAVLVPVIQSAQGTPAKVDKWGESLFEKTFYPSPKSVDYDAYVRVLGVAAQHPGGFEFLQDIVVALFPYSLSTLKITSPSSHGGMSYLAGALFFLTSMVAAGVVTAEPSGLNQVALTFFSMVALPASALFGSGMGYLTKGVSREVGRHNIREQIQEAISSHLVSVKSEDQRTKIFQPLEKVTQAEIENVRIQVGGSDINSIALFGIELHPIMQRLVGEHLALTADRGAVNPALTKFVAEIVKRIKKNQPLLDIGNRGKESGHTQSAMVQLLGERQIQLTKVLEMQSEIRAKSELLTTKLEQMIVSLQFSTVGSDSEKQFEATQKVNELKMVTGLLNATATAIQAEGQAAREELRMINSVASAVSLWSQRAAMVNVAEQETPFTDLLKALSNASLCDAQ